MAIIVKVSRPEDLLQDIKQNIDDNYISNWQYDLDGDFTSAHNDLQNLAWFNAYVIKPDKLIFGIKGRKNVKMHIALYSIYHSEFIRMMLTFFSSQIDEIKVLPPFYNSYDTKNIEG